MSNNFLFSIPDLEIVHEFCESVSLRRPNYKMITSLAKYPIPEKGQLRILLLPTATTYEWGAEQSIFVLDKLISAFYATKELDQIDTKAVMEIIRLYLLDLDGSCEFATKFDYLFFWHLMRKLPPSVDQCDEEMKFIETTSKKCVDISNIVAQAYAALALWCGSLDAGLLAAASASSSLLYSCVMVDCIESDVHCSLAVSIFRKLVNLDVMHLYHEDYDGVMKMLAIWYIESKCQYDCEKLKRMLTFIEELVLSCDFKVGHLFIKTMPRYRQNIRQFSTYFICVRQLLAHLIGDMILTGAHMDLVIFINIKKVYFPHYGLRPVGRGRSSVPFEAASSLKEICRYSIHRILRKKMSIAEYLRFVASLDYPENLKAYLKLWPTVAMVEELVFKGPKWSGGQGALRAADERCFIS
jgi:hypothetical protein